MGIRRWLFGARRRRTVGVLLAAGAVAAAMVAVVPAFGETPENALRLHMAADGQYFRFADLPDQVIETTPNGKRSCELKTNTPFYGTLAVPTGSNGGPLPVGNVDFSFGVKSSGSNSNGTPCSQVQLGERLVLARGSSLASQVFNGARLDLEATSDAVIRIMLFGSGGTHYYYLETGTSIVSGSPIIDKDPATTDSTGTTGRVTAQYGESGRAFGCNTANSSGPNSSSNDNCPWTIRPGIRFTSIEITVVGPANGSVSLEGSSDWGGNTAYDTLLYVDSAPVANPDSYSTNEDTPLSVAAPGVLLNDTDDDGDSLTAVVVSGPSNGDLSLAPDGGFTYTPYRDYFGSDSFTYRASDGAANSNTATVSITVAPVNDPPVAKGEPLNATEDTPLTVSADDLATDPDGDTLSITDASAVNGMFDGGLYTPDEDFCGEDTLNFTVTDGSASVSDTVTINVACVNDTPVANPDSYSTNEDTPLSVAAPGVLSNDTDADVGDTLTVSAFDASSAQGGTVGVATDGSFLYTPLAGFSGTDSFGYTTSDGSSQASTTVTITVVETLDCGDTVLTGDGITLPLGVVTRLTNTDGSDCIPKLFLLTSGVNPFETIDFGPEDGDNPQEAAYSAELTFLSYAAENPVPQQLQYDPERDGTYVVMEWCLASVIDTSIANGEIVRTIISADLPVGHTWCIGFAETRVAAEGEIQTTWWVYGRDDPGFRFG